jgi:integrase
VTNIKARNQNGSRSRVLSERELAVVWNACADDDYSRIVKLLILTGQRKSEIGSLDWREVNAGERMIELPPSRTKNGRAHIVPLSDEALAILKNVKPGKGRDFVFGRGAGGFSGRSKAKAVLTARIAKAEAHTARKTDRKPMAPWVIHDIRRTVVTGLHEKAIAQPHIVEAIVNHASGYRADVGGVYNRAVYLNERRRALDLWGQHIAALVAGRESNVIPIARSAGLG